MRTVALSRPDQAQQHYHHRSAAAGLHWDALSDDEEAVGAVGMDGYTSSDDSYGGHMGGFAFEGAVSEDDDLYSTSNTRLALLTAETACPTAEEDYTRASAIKVDDVSVDYLIKYTKKEQFDTVHRHHATSLPAVCNQTLPAGTVCF